MGQATPTTKASASSAQNFVELVKKFDTAMLITHTGTHGPVHARPMAVAEVSEDGSIWFITGRDTAKVEELRQDSELVATFQDARLFVSVSGRGEMSDDRAHIQRIWKEPFRVWFDGKDDPNIVLVRLTPSAGEYWDNRGAKGLKFALQFAAAYVSGKELREPTSPAQHAKVQF